MSALHATLILTVLPTTPASEPAPAPGVERRPRIALVRPLDGDQSDVCASIAAAEGGFYLAGYTTRAPGADDAFVARVDAHGETLWRRSIAGNGDAALWSVQALADGGALAAGWAKSTRGDRDALLVRLDRSGAVVWQRTYGSERDERLWSLDLTADGVFAAGESAASGRSTGLVLRATVDGAETWLRAPGEAESERVFAVQSLADGGYVLAGLAGHGPRESAGYDARIVRYDAHGAAVWSRAHGGADFDVAHDLALLPDGSVAVLGYSFTGPERAGDPFLLQLSGAGDVEWSRTYPGDDDERAVHLERLSSGSFAFAGYARAGSASSDLVVRATDARGEPVWQLRFGGADSELGRALVQTGDGALVVAGHSTSYGPLERVLLIRLEALGV